MALTGCIGAAPDGRILAVNKGRKISVWVVAVIAFVVLFEVNFGAGNAGGRQVPDPEIEAAFEACYAEKDQEIHATAFATIDNPDVQKEFITSNRARAVAACRELHPERLVTVDEDGGSLPVRLTPRFW